MNKPIVWINRTTSYHWKRPVVGIVRVETELSEQLKKLYPGGIVKECVWNGKEFFERQEKVSIPSTIDTPDKNDNPQFIFEVISKRRALANIGQGFFSLTPPSLRSGINRVLLKLKPKIGKIIRRLRARRNSKINSTDVVSSMIGIKNARNRIIKHSIFNSGDVLLSVGADWSYSFFKEFYYLRTDKKVKIITCCYDLIPVLYPQYCVADVANFFSSYFRELADGSDEIVCISEDSRKNLLELLHATGSRMVNTSVFELGDSVPNVADEISHEVEAILRKEFILFVSSIEKRKNHEVIYRAYHLLCKKGKDKELPPVVFVGMPGWGVAGLLKDIELDPLTKGKIIQLHDVNDAELKKLYEATMFCVFPSLYEGWGLPVAEALALGKPVICSNSGALPEVAGDLAIYVDPWEPHVWATEIYKMITDKTYRESLSNKIIDTYKKRSWVNTGLQVKAVIDKYIVSG